MQIVGSSLYLKAVLTKYLQYMIAHLSLEVRQKGSIYVRNFWLRLLALIY